MRRSTELIHAGEGVTADRTPSLITPICATSTFVFDSAAQVQAYQEGREAGYLYSRYENPTVVAVEQKLAAVDGAECSLLFSSGQAASTHALLTLLQQGDEVVCSAAIYGGTHHLIADLLPRFGIVGRLVSLEALADSAYDDHEHDDDHDQHDDEHHHDDSGAYEGGEVPIFYDPMISKLITWGDTREHALQRMRRALAEYEVRGIRTTIPFFQWILDDEDFRAARFDTSFIERKQAAQTQRAQTDAAREDLAAIAAAVHVFSKRSRAAQVASAPAASRWRDAARTDARR